MLRCCSLLRPRLITSSLKRDSSHYARVEEFFNGLL
jgi:hypothetical protein